MLLIQENTGVLGSDFEIVKTDTEYYIEGIFIKSDTPNGNNRVYPKKCLESGIDRYYTEFISKNKSIGELDHPTPPRTDAKLSERALRVESLEMQPNGDVIGKAKILTGAKKGKELLEVIEEGTEFGTSFRALTQLKNGSDGFMYAGPDIYFRAFDAVLVPSVGEDVQSFQENIEFQNVWNMDPEDGIVQVSESLIDLITGESWDMKDGKLCLNKKIIDINKIQQSLQMEKRK